MSIHPSLSLSDKDKKQRSVLKRIERLKLMLEKEQWKETDDVYGLPKIKTVRIKIKKEKAETPTAEVAASSSAAIPSGSKEQAPAKASAARPQEKKNSL